MQFIGGTFRVAIKYPIFRIFCFLFVLYGAAQAETANLSETSCNKLAPKSVFSSLDNLLLDACKFFVENSSPDKKRNLLGERHYKFSLTPAKGAWEDLQKVKEVLGSPQEYRKPLTSESYDRIMNPEILLALAKTFVQFFPAYNKWGKIKRINEKELKSLVDSLNWSAERRRKTFFDKVELKRMIEDMDDASNPDTMGGAWARGVWRAHMLIYKRNVISTGSNCVFPLKVFLHELAHCLPGYRETHFNDTLAIAFLAFAGINAEDIFHLPPQLNISTFEDKDHNRLISEQFTPFNFENINNDLLAISYFTRHVPSKYYDYQFPHSFVAAGSRDLQEPYNLNRNLGLYTAKRFQSVLNQLLQSPDIDTQTAYLLAKEDMLEALRLIYEGLLNLMGSGYFHREFGKTKDIKVQSFKPSQQRILYTAA